MAHLPLDVREKVQPLVEYIADKYDYYFYIFEALNITKSTGLQLSQYHAENYHWWFKSSDTYDNVMYDDIFNEIQKFNNKNLGIELKLRSEDATNGSIISALESNDGYFFIITVKCDNYTIPQSLANSMGIKESTGTIYNIVSDDKYKTQNQFWAVYAKTNFYFKELDSIDLEHRSNYYKKEYNKCLKLLEKNKNNPHRPNYRPYLSVSWSNSRSDYEYSSEYDMQDNIQDNMQDDLLELLKTKPGTKQFIKYWNKMQDLYGLKNHQ